MAEELNKLTYESKAIDRALQAGIGQFIGYIVESVKESAPDEAQIYISYTTEQILLAFLWKIANPRTDATPKEDFVDYFNQLNDVNSQNLKSWVTARPYNKTDYEQFQNQFKRLKEDEIAQFMLQHYTVSPFVKTENKVV